MNNHILSSAALAVCFSSAAYGAGPGGAYPPAGEYRIDTEVIINIGNAGGVEQRISTDGATGNMTTTSRAPDGAVATSVVKGEKPATWCVKPPKPTEVPRNSPYVCQNARATSNSSLSAVCGSTAVDSAFQVIDAKTWEHTMTVQVRANRAAAASPAQALAMAAPGMTPAQRLQSQQALAGLPSQAQMDSMKADLLREAEEDVRTAPSPREAEAARQSLQALRQQMNGTAVQQTIRVKERWTQLKAACS